MRSRNPVTLAHRRYMVSLIGALVLYTILLVTSIYFLKHGLTGVPRLLVALLPVPAVIGCFIAIVQLVQRVDEFERRILIESLAAGAGVTALVAVTYAFLENAGFPTLTAWWTWATLCSSWLIASFVIRFRYR